MIHKKTQVLCSICKNVQWSRENYSVSTLIKFTSLNLPGDKGRPARDAENPTVICEPIV
jgi:hypothetical protein